MSRQQRITRLPLAGAIFLSLLTCAYLMYLVGGKRSPKSRSPIAITKHTMNTTSDDTLKYWTAARMRNAKPAEMPHVDALDPEKQDPQRPPS